MRDCAGKVNATSAETQVFASMSIVGRAWSCVKAPQDNGTILTFRGGHRLLMSLLNAGQLSGCTDAATQSSRDSGNLSEELGAPTIGAKYDSIRPARSCGPDVG